MAYTYLITGATSDVGAALIRRLLTEAPGEDRTILAQGCGDLARLDALVQQFPGRIVTFDADLSSPEAVDALCARFGKDLPCPTHFVHLPALPVVNAKFKAFDEARFQKDWEIQVHSAVKLCKAVLPAMSKAKFGRVLFIQTSYTIGCPPKHSCLCNEQERYRRAGEKPGCGVRPLWHNGKLRGPQHDGDPLFEGYAGPDRAGRSGRQPNGPQRHAGGCCPGHGVPVERGSPLYHRRYPAGHGRFRHCLTLCCV